MLILNYPIRVIKNVSKKNIKKLKIINIYNSLYVELININDFQK